VETDVVAYFVRQHAISGPFGAGIGLKIFEKNGVVKNEALAANLAGEGVFDIGGFELEPLRDADGAADFADNLLGLLIGVENEGVFVFHVGVESAAAGDAHALLADGRERGEEGKEEEDCFHRLGVWKW
jgi:hypothetical protein